MKTDINKIITQLEKKAQGSGRMPSLKKIAELCDVLNIHYYYDGDYTRTTSNKASSNPYATSTTKAKGTLLKVGKIELDTSLSWYRHTTKDLAQELLELIKTKR
tara:strand:+ start:2649 stop:2960 length:312 start_codon:yes stop_codon:yes gene_type:complete